MPKRPLEQQDGSEGAHAKRSKTLKIKQEVIDIESDHEDEGSDLQRLPPSSPATADVQAAHESKDMSLTTAALNFAQSGDLNDFNKGFFDRKRKEIQDRKRAKAVIDEEKKTAAKGKGKATGTDGGMAENSEKDYTREVWKRYLEHGDDNKLMADYALTSHKAMFETKKNNKTTMTTDVDDDERSMDGSGETGNTVGLQRENASASTMATHQLPTITAIKQEVVEIQSEDGMMEDPQGVSPIFNTSGTSH